MARRKPRAPRRGRAKPARKALAPTTPEPGHLNPTQTVAARHLFWENVIREILTSISMLSAMRPEEPKQLTGEHAAEAQADAAAGGGNQEYDPSLFDGRLAVITKAGERIAIAQVVPLLACGINGPQDRGLSLALECTVFQINTPDGHVYTLPLHEIRAFHALTPELMQRLERAARHHASTHGEPSEDQLPFGFAAFTSLMQPSQPREPAPPDPTE